MLLDILLLLPFVSVSFSVSEKITDPFGVVYPLHWYMKQTVDKQFVNIHWSSSKIRPQCLIGSHVLPGFIHWLNVLFGLHPECCNAGTPVVLHRVFIVKAGWALIGRGPNWLHTLDHARWGVEEAVVWIGRLQALRWTHEPWDGMHGRGTGDGRGQPGIEWHRVGHWPHARRHRGTIEG